MYVFLVRIISGVPHHGTRIKHLRTRILVFLLPSENPFHCFSLCNLQEKKKYPLNFIHSNSTTKLSCAKHSLQQHKNPLLYLVMPVVALNLAILDVFNVRTSGGLAKN